MDNDAFRSTYRAVSERSCAFEKAILSNRAGCSQAHKFCIAERDGVGCRSDEAQADCAALLEILRQRARFALHIADERAALPHAKAMRIQVGGLRGILGALSPGLPIPARIADVRRTVRAARAQFGDFSLLPFQEIVRQIAAFQDRRRPRGRE